MNSDYKRFDQEANDLYDSPTKQAFIRFLRSQENVSEIKIHDESCGDFSEGKYDVSYVENEKRIKVDVEWKEAWSVDCGEETSEDLMKQFGNIRKKYDSIHVAKRKRYNIDGTKIEYDKLPDYVVVVSSDYRAAVMISRKEIPNIVEKTPRNRYGAKENFLSFDKEKSSLKWIFIPSNSQERLDPQLNFEI